MENIDYHRRGSIKNPFQKDGTVLPSDYDFDAELNDAPKRDITDTLLFDQLLLDLK